MTRDQRERMRRDVLRRLDELQAENERIHTDAERRAAARAIGAEHYLPEPQDELELPAHGR